jgi:hydroxymethylpyrimidine/phosphomethylpyrimidine kinase
MVSTSGSQLLPQAAISTLINSLLPLTTILTPNLPEAKLLLQTAGVQVKEPENIDDIIAMAHKILGLGPKWVLLKGGHLPLTRERVISREESEKEVVLNVLVGETGLTTLESAYLKSDNTHGTGCSLACKSVFVTPALGWYTRKRRTLTIEKLQLHATSHLGWAWSRQ